MNPLNLLEDAMALRIEGTHYTIGNRITWEVIVQRQPVEVPSPDDGTHQILEFEAPVGNDPADAYAVPEGLQALVHAAACYLNLPVHVHPVRTVGPHPHTTGGLSGKELDELRGRLLDHIEAYTFHTGSHDVKIVSPAPRCSHGYLGPHTYTAGNVASGLIETVCPGPPRPYDDEAEAESPIARLIRKNHSTGGTVTYDIEGGPLIPPSRAFCGSAVPHAAHLYGGNLRCPGLEAVPPRDEVTCIHGETRPHGTDALDRGPTCPGPTGQWPEGYEPVTVKQDPRTTPEPSDPRTPVCATCEVGIVPATGWGRGWEHRDGLPAGRYGDHVPTPKVYIDPPPKG